VRPLRTVLLLFFVRSKQSQHSVSHGAARGRLLFECQAGALHQRYRDVCWHAVEADGAFRQQLDNRLMLLAISARMRLILSLSLLDCTTSTFSLRAYHAVPRRSFFWQFYLPG